MLKKFINLFFMFFIFTSLGFCVQQGQDLPDMFKEISISSNSTTAFLRNDGLGNLEAKFNGIYRSLADKEENTVIVRSADDFGTIQPDGSRHLQLKKIYDLNNNTIFLDSPLMLPYEVDPYNSIGCIIQNGTIIEAFGGNVFISSSTLNVNILSQIFCISGTGEATVFNLKQDTYNGNLFLIKDSLFYGFKNLGSFSYYDFVSHFTNYLEYGDGIKIDNSYSSENISVLYSTSKNLANSFCVKISSCPAGSFFSSLTRYGNPLSPNETIFEFDNTTTNNLSINLTGNIIITTNIFTSNSLTEKNLNFTSFGNNGLPNSTITAVIRSEGNSTAYTIIQGQSYKTLINTNIAFSSSTLERITTNNTDGTLFYNGTNAATISLDCNINVDPQTATKLLRAQAAVVKASQRIITFTNTTDIINEASTPRQNGDTIIFKNSAGTLPTGLDKNEIYYVVNKTANSFQVAHTLGGSPALFTTDGTGTNSYQVANMVGSIGRASITAANPVDLICQALCSVSNGDSINLFVWNEDDAVDILVRNIYIRLKE